MVLSLSLQPPYARRKGSRSVFTLTLFAATLYLTGLFEVQAADKLRLATWNLDDYNSSDRLVAGSFHPDYPKPEGEKKALRRAILAVRPDVLAIQEIGSQAHLEELQRDLAADGLEFSHFGLVEGSDPLRKIAFLSRVAPLAVHKHEAPLLYPHYPEFGPVKRGFLELEFPGLNSGSRWSLYVVHCRNRKSGSPTDTAQAREERQAELDVLREMILARQGSDAPVVVVGDLGENPASATLRALLHPEDQPWFRLVPMADTAGAAWTWVWPRRNLYERLDYILYLPALEGVFNLGKGGIHDDPDTLAASDHRLIWVDFLPLEATPPEERVLQPETDRLEQPKEKQ